MDGGAVTQPGTFDEWLLTRAQPTVPKDQTGVTISSADFVATALVTGAFVALDLGMQPTRDGLRDLLTEFEEATKGQRIQMRMVAPLDHGAVEPVVSLTPEGRVQLAIVTEGAGHVSGIVMDPVNAINLAGRITELVRERLTEWPNEGE